MYFRMLFRIWLSHVLSKLNSGDGLNKRKPNISVGNFFFMLKARDRTDKGNAACVLEARSEAK